MIESPYDAFLGTICNPPQIPFPPLVKTRHHIIRTRADYTADGAFRGDGCPRFVRRVRCGNRWEY